MNRKPKKYRKTVKLLTDPEPEFVSLVNHGANQTPFRAVKVDDLSTVTKPNQNQIMKKNTKVEKSSGKGRNGDINKIVFKAEHFADEDTVRKWMDQNGYESYAIEAGDSEFVVKGIDADSLTDIQEVEAEDGVRMYVGKLVETEEAPESTEKSEESDAGDSSSSESETSQKEEEPKARQRERKQKSENSESLIATPEMVKKFSWWMADDSKGKTISDVMSDANDGLPIGIHELNDAFYAALRNTVKAGDFSKIKSLTAEFGQYIDRIARLFEGVQKDDGYEELVEKSITLNEAPQSEETKDDTTSEDPEKQEAQKSEGEDPEGKKTEAKKGDEPSTSEAGEEASKKSEDTDPTVTALQAITQKLDKIEADNKEFRDTVNKTVEGIKEKTEKSASRISSMEAIRQTRKGSESGEQTTKSEEEDESKEKKTASEDRIVRDNLGFQ